MAKVVELDGPTLAWARDRFAQYYRSASIDPPPRLLRREFAAFPFARETMMRRHASFRTPEEFGRFLRGEVPRHVYYSTAYYRKPSEPTMAQKEWLGADLIFDLDADHLRGAEKLDYAGQLLLVKERLLALVDDFLVRDFGIDPQSMLLAFSGGRGYHVHVREERFLPLTSPERRELVDYLSGTGFDPGSVIGRRREGDPRSEDAPPAGRVAPTRPLAPPEAPGWTGRETRALLALLSRWEALGTEGAAAELEAMGVPRPKARRWAGLLITEGGARRIRSDPQLAVPATLVPNDLLEVVLKQAEIVVQGETDAPVTTDIHRLIRLPGSLHGGTGLRVTALPRDRLESFDPFRDAVVAKAMPGRARVTPRVDAEYPFPDGGVRVRAEQPIELPTTQALFLVLRGEAELRPSPT